MKKRVNILFQCDNNFAFMTGVAFTSLMLNATPNVVYYIYVLTPDMSEENRKKYRSVSQMKNKKSEDIEVHLEFLDATICKKEVETWNVPSHRGSWVTYYKLLLDRFFKDRPEVEKIIHIGADTLVTGSLEELADFDFHGMPFAMNWSEYMRFPKYSKDAQYVVAEMVYFNLPEWRKHNCERRILDHVKKYGDLYGSKDQGILCTRFIGEYAQLPLKFNIYGMTYYFSGQNRIRFNNAPIISKEEIKEAYAHPEIIHLARTFLYRPCEKGSMDRLNDMWWGYCKQSPWADMEPLEPNPPLILPEKVYRWLFKYCPIRLAEWLYIKGRHWSANVQWFVWMIKNGGPTPKI